MYESDCQHAKEMWRDAYFTAKLEGRSPNVEPAKEEGEKEEGEGKASPKDDFDEKKKREREAFEKKIAEFRKKARGPPPGGRCS